MTFKQRITRLENYVLDDQHNGYTWEEIKEAYYARFPERLAEEVKSKPQLQRYIDNPPPARVARRWARVVELYKAYRVTHPIQSDAEAES